MHSLHDLGIERYAGLTADVIQMGLAPLCVLLLVRWEAGAFASDAEHRCVAGKFTRAFVDRESGRSASVPDGIRRAIEALPATK